MLLEIERKYLVSGLEYLALQTSCLRLAQGYLCTDPERVVRIRIAGATGTLTVKGKSSDSGLSRTEIEVEIPPDKAGALMSLCLPGIIEKTRYKVPFGPFIIEVDVFHGENEGLVLAEVELPSEETVFNAPSWFGQEETGDFRYYNAWLSQHPYRTW